MGGEVPWSNPDFLVACLGMVFFLKQYFNCSYPKKIAGERHEIPIKCSLMNIQQVSYGVGGKNLYIVIQQCLMSAVCRAFHRRFVCQFLLPSFAMLYDLEFSCLGFL